MGMNGWKPHNGGPCPVDEDSFPQVLTKSGEQDCERASDFQWEWTGEFEGDEVVAYREMEHASLSDLIGMVDTLFTPTPLLEEVRWVEVVRKDENSPMFFPKWPSE